MSDQAYIFRVLPIEFGDDGREVVHYAAQKEKVRTDSHSRLATLSECGRDRDGKTGGLLR